LSNQKLWNSRSLCTNRWPYCTTSYFTNSLCLLMSQRIHYN